MPDSRRIVQNPVLKLLTLPTREGITARGKSDARIKPKLFRERQRSIISRIGELRSDKATLKATHGDKVLVWIGLDENSQAPTLTPGDLFSPSTGAPLLFAWRDGYVAEFSTSAFTRIVSAVTQASTPAIRSDIYGIDRVRLFSDALLDSDRMELEWQRAATSQTGDRLFSLRLPAFLDQAAQDSVVSHVGTLAISGDIRLPAGGRTNLIGEPDGSGINDRWLTPSQMPRELRALSTRRSFIVAVPTMSTLQDLILSGSVARWEAVVPLTPTVPGAGAEPDTSLTLTEDAPIVGVIDGGYRGSRYAKAVAWRQTPPLVSDRAAASDHGNRVSSLVVDAHLWSNRLSLPQLQCRIGVVQAVPKPGSGIGLLDTDIVSHIEEAFKSHPDTHIWNLSANIDKDCDDYDVSDLGRGLARISRENNKLLIVSAGNRNPDGYKIAPPADCEAALVVSGRINDSSGLVAGACTKSRVGYGPEGMLKPETSWFSRHRVVGGEVVQGTSFAAPLVSRLAAHTWSNLHEPNPDLVKALLLSACDLDAYQAELGFGSPIKPELPWICPPNAAVLAWTSTMSAQQRYYWTGIRIPPSLMKSGRFVGRAKLVGILCPEVTEDGHHYFQNRLETNLAFRKPRSDGKWDAVPIVGCLNPNQRELDARREDNKWDPVRVYAKDFTGKRGVLINSSQPSLHVYARTYWRDSFKYDGDYKKDVESKVSFVVVLESDDPEADTYNEFRRIMAENVVAATVEQDIEIDDL